MRYTLFTQKLGSSLISLTKIKYYKQEERYIKQSETQTKQPVSKSKTLSSVHVNLDLHGLDTREAATAVAQR